MKNQTSVKELLVNQGFRVTQARAAVLDFLVKTQKPVDVVAIEAYLAKNMIDADQVTIYRMLEAFVEKNIIERLDFHEGKFRYELIKGEHHHLICESCGTITDISDCPIENIEQSILKNQKFLVKRHALEFFGYCRQCQ